MNKAGSGVAALVGMNAVGGIDGCVASGVNGLGWNVGKVTFVGDIISVPDAIVGKITAVGIPPCPPFADVGGKIGVRVSAGDPPG